MRSLPLLSLNRSCGHLLKVLPTEKNWEGKFLTPHSLSLRSNHKSTEKETKALLGASLVAQWLRICLSMQGSILGGGTKSMGHN